MKASRLVLASALLIGAALPCRSASADPTPSPLATPPSTPTPTATPTSTPTPTPPATSVAASESASLEAGQHFTIDPVADGVLIVGGAGFAALLSLVLGSGEIQPTAPGPASNLLSFDRGAVTQTIDTNASVLSDVGLYTAIGFAVLDPILSGARDGWDALAVDAVMYAETLAITETLTDITKIAVRRPRPVDYLNCAKAGATSGCSATDLELSFFSGHAATVASIGATATYLAFIRDPKSVRPWITLVTSLALTSFVSYERVRSGNHFPTDVIAGSMAGAAVGVLIPHLHRHAQEAPPVWIGGAPTPNGGGIVTLGGVF